MLEPLTQQKVREFCQRWKLTEFSLFGSALREDFGAESDVDILVEIAPNSGWSLYDWIDMREELENLLGRKVDLVEKSGLRNPIRRQAILESRKIIYAA